VRFFSQDGIAARFGQSTWVHPVTRDEALRTLDMLYAAALGEAAWSTALTMIADVFASSATTLEIRDVAATRLLYFESARIDPSTISLYQRDFTANPRADFMIRSSRRIGFDQLFITEDEMDRDPFYMDFLAPSGLRYFVAAQTPLIDHRISGVLSIQRSGRERGLRQDDLGALRALSPHVDRAVALFWNRMRFEIDPDHLDRELARHGLTPAERRLASAVATGESLPHYAKRNTLSINTVYTHYRHVKEKMDTERLVDLTARLRTL
jgi:DNA-binding CsgD family transcriptional regulator